MEYTVMEKIDSMTPWHALRSYPTECEAKWAAYNFAKRRAEGAKYSMVVITNKQKRRK
jgi:hypothetical protein